MAMTFKEAPGSYARGRRVNAEEWNGFSRTFETGGGAELRFGEPVARGVGDRGCVAYTGANEFIGIAEAHLVLPHVGDHYLQYDTVAVCEYGVIGVDVGSASVDAGAPAGWDNTARLWVEADTSVPQVAGAVFETSGTGIVALRLRRATS